MTYWTAPARLEKTIDEIVQNLCEDLETTLVLMKSESRIRPLVDKRHIMAYVLHRYLRLSQSEVGKILNRDHASIIHAYKKCDNLGLIEEKFYKYKSVKIRKDETTTL